MLAFFHLIRIILIESTSQTPQPQHQSQLVTHHSSLQRSAPFHVTFMLSGWSSWMSLLHFGISALGEGLDRSSNRFERNRCGGCTPRNQNAYGMNMWRRFEELNILKYLNLGDTRLAMRTKSHIYRETHGPHATRPNPTLRPGARTRSERVPRRCD